SGPTPCHRPAGDSPGYATRSRQRADPAVTTHVPAPAPRGPELASETSRRESLVRGRAAVVSRLVRAVQRLRFAARHYRCRGSRKSLPGGDDRRAPAVQHLPHANARAGTAAMSPVDRTAAVDQLPAELDLLDSWASWRQASEDVQSAYQHWSHCATGHRALAF